MVTADEWRLLKQVERAIGALNAAVSEANQADIEVELRFVETTASGDGWARSVLVLHGARKVFHRSPDGWK